MRVKSENSHFSLGSWFSLTDTQLVFFILCNNNLLSRENLHCVSVYKNFYEGLINVIKLQGFLKLHMTKDIELNKKPF